MSDKSRMHLSEEEVVNNDDVGESSVIVLSEGTIDVPTITPPAKSKVCLTLDAAIENELKRDRKLDPNMDTKTLRRLAAQRSRMRRSGYIHDLEMKIKDLEEYVKNMKAQAEFYNENRRLIQEENNSLRRAIDIRANEAKIGQNYMEELQRLIISLKENLANEGKSFTNPLTIRTEEMEMRMMMQESVTISTKPYSIEFYEQRLKKMEMNQDHHNDHQLLIHAARSESEADESFTGLINFDDVDEEGEGVDQYLNLDEMLNLDPN
ncbi:hypothetical protein C2S52_018778 [Perilla frutescens var. hirtella]|nr:hypothetical protein C2S52_018778 [Perilla frutescens var. hirtella]